MISRQIARRTLLTRTGFGLGATIGAGLGSSVALAEAKARPSGDVWSQGYWADKGGVKLAMYRKWPGNLGGGPDKPLPVLFLVHGSSLSAQSSFDLSVPGSEYSMMNVFARSGFDVWTMDHENYGKSGRTSGNSDIASGVADLVAACRAKGVQFRLGADAGTASGLLAGFDTIVIATGADYRFGLRPFVNWLLDTGIARAPGIARLLSSPSVRNWFYYKARRGTAPRMRDLARPGQRVIVIGDAAYAGKSKEAITTAFDAALLGAGAKDNVEGKL